MEKVDNFAINWKELSTTELKNWVKKFNDKVEELNDIIVEREDDDEEIDIPRNWKEYYEIRIVENDTYSTMIKIHKDDNKGAYGQYLTKRDYYFNKYPEEHFDVEISLWYISECDSEKLEDENF